ncbi:MAG TPA: acylphosphatase [Bacteroidales bacterium]|nr:acylphosphatase [Bacteroidales bacterium]
MKKAISIRVRGRVQGVGFRYFTRSKANEFAISGFASNMSDGSVYIEAEGNKENLEAFLESCRKGPASSLVTQLDVVSIPVCNYNGFEIR